MRTKRLEFSIVESGSILWIGAGDLGGASLGAFNLWDGSLLEQGVAMVTELYQDDEVYVRLVLGELNAQENEEWVACARGWINAECGKILVSTVFSGMDDFDSEYAEFEEAENSLSSQIGVIVDVPPAHYQVEIYSYPPGDLSGAWFMLVDEEPIISQPRPPHMQYENAEAYFRRTRPRQKMPAWVNNEDDGKQYIDFVIHLSPLQKGTEFPAINSEGYAPWEFRKPERFPKGLASKVEWD